MTTKHITLIAALAFAACTTTSSDEDEANEQDLDVAMDEGQGDGEAKPLTYSDIVKQPAPAKGAKLPVNAVMNWQAFFKAPPAAKDRSLLEKKLERWADDVSAAELVKKAAAETALGRAAAAEVSLRKALRIDPKNLEAQLELASLYLRKQDLKTAFDLLTQVRDGISTSDELGQGFIFRYRYVLALSYIARGDRDKGHKVLSDLIGVDKSFSPAYAALASSYLAQGKDQVAEFVLRRGIDRGKDPAMLQNLMGVIAQRSNQFESARAWYDRALETSPTLVAALVNRAGLSTRNFEYAAAEEDLKQALAIDPRNADALVALGVVQKRQGNPTAAKESFTKAIDVAPEHAHARFNLAVLMADELKRPNEAMRLFHEVLQTTAPNSEIKELARSYINELKQTGQPY